MNRPRVGAYTCSTMAEPLTSVRVTRVRGADRSPGDDHAATEEPLEIRLHNRPFAVVMRTPGADRELAAGFLLSEQVLRTPDDLGTIEYCADATAEHPENIINVTLVGAPGDALDVLLAGRRQVTMNSSCGLCGRLTIESLRADAPPLVCTWRIDAPVLVSVPERLRTSQRLFDATGGLHAAGLFSIDGELVAVAEDVGRHNAVDKVIGRMLMQEALPLGDRLLFVSGRASYEIVQKAFLAGVPLVGSVSAPSSLAIDLASEAGITLVGFLRGDTFNIYTHPERIETP
jgi:FdhD protein